MGLGWKVSLLCPFLPFPQPWLLFLLPALLACLSHTGTWHFWPCSLWVPVGYLQSLGFGKLAV